MALAAYFLFFAQRVKLKPSLTSGLVCSALFRCCAGAFTIGGPMMALYFVAIARDKETYVANMQFLFFTTNIINFAMRAARGYFSPRCCPRRLGMACVLAGCGSGCASAAGCPATWPGRWCIAVGVSGLVTLAEQLMK